MKKIPLMLFAGEGDPRVNELLKYANVEYRAVIKLGSKQIITRILESFHQSGVISYYYIIGIPKDLVELPSEIDEGCIEFLEAKDMDVADRLYYTTNHILEQSKNIEGILPANSTNALYVTADIPFLQSDSIKKFYDLTRDDSFDLYMSTVPRKLMEEKYGDTKRTFVPVRQDGVRIEYCLGDLGIMNLTKVEESMKNIRAIRKNRKKVLLLILFLKPSILFRFLLKRLTFKSIEGALNNVFKVKSKIIEMENLDIAMDIDTVHQFELVLKEFKST